MSETKYRAMAVVSNLKNGGNLTKPLRKWTWDDLERLLIREFYFLKMQVIRECSGRAIDYGNEVLAAKVFSQQIAKRISSLIACEEETIE